MTLPIVELMEQAVPARALWQLRRGATITPGGVTFTVWAPRARDVVVHVAGGSADHIDVQETAHAAGVVGEPLGTAVERRAIRAAV